MVYAVRRARRSSNRRGQTLVEFALVSPLFIIFLFGIFDIGRYIYIRGTIEANAVQAVRTMTLLENRSSDCPAWSVTQSLGSGLNVTIDSRSVYGDSATPGVAMIPANSGDAYLYPAVASSNAAGACSPAANIRPSGMDEACITYNFAALTPAFSSFFSGVTMTASASAQSEYSGSPLISAYTPGCHP